MQFCENKIPDDQVEKSKRGSAQMSELVLCTIVRNISSCFLFHALASHSPDSATNGSKGQVSSTIILSYICNIDDVIQDF